jgi:hypothetical protein
MSLSGQFLLTAFAVMLFGMLALGTWVSWQIEKSVSDFLAGSAPPTVSRYNSPQIQ